MKKNEPIICITSRCDQRCVFCSRGGCNPVDSPGRIKKLINMFGDSICVEGGEPALSKDLPRWVAYARKRGVRDIILVTNGTKLERADFVRALLKAGVTMFNVHLPAHNAGLFDLLTRTKNTFEKRAAAVRNLLAVAGGGRVRLTLVVNSLIGRFLPQYARFVAENFPGILYIEINMIKVLGHVEKRTWLVPRLADVTPGLIKAFRVFDKSGIKFLTDGFPLCLAPGYEDRAIDTFKLGHLKSALYLGEKEHCPACKKCTLKNICPGPRTDYLELYGPAGLKASKKAPGPIVERAANQLK
ncbi:MAG: radical SAM protein [Elusimicrobia bacterium]|nr:radical SAM protein [Elusimicrobiota bacterium]